MRWSAQRDGWIGDMPFGLRTNGYWDADRIGFVGLNHSNTSMLFEFARPVSSVSAVVNYAPLEGGGPIPTFEALDALGQVFDIATIDVRTPNGVNEGALLSLAHETSDIFALRYRARYGVLDNLTWSGHGFIPAPSGIAGLGLVVLAASGRRRRTF